MALESAYQEALDYLYSFIDYSLTRNARYSPENFDLERMRAFMAELGNPQNNYTIIHIAGTKGKGSVAAMCAGALQAAGYRVGLYTSPHLTDFTERIRIDGQPIQQGAFAEIMAAAKPKIESVPRLTTFEIGTGLAFLYFDEMEADIVVAEVGLGGRLDATNIVNPLVSVITSISYDHTKFLGDTLAAIAAEKAGIIKPGVPVVLAPQQDAARKTVERIASQLQAPLVSVGQDYLYAPLSRSLRRQTMFVWSAAEQPLADAYIESGGALEWEPVRLHIPLLGAHQIENAATAYATLQVVRDRGVAIPQAAIRSGFAEVSWPGRFEVLHRNPPLIVDAAHNRDSALKLRLAMDDYFPGLPLILVFGASEDKDIKGMFTELLPRVRQVIATRSIHPRAMDPEQLVELAHQFGRPAKAFPSIEEALLESLRLAEDEVVVLVTGSLFLAAGARAVWHDIKPEALGVK